MNIAVAKECAALSDEGKITFPEVVKRLLQAGIDAYYADLIASSKTFYGDNAAHTLGCASHFKEKVPEHFQKEQVVEAIRQVQAGKINYEEFVKRVMRAGVMGYMAFLKGRQVVYFGRKGDQHVEKFP